MRRLVAAALLAASLTGCQWYRPRILPYSGFRRELHDQRGTITLRPGR